MGQHTCCNQQKVKRGLWSPEEDEKLIRYITTYGYGCWSEVPDKAGLQRCGKSCRLRWINYLRPDIRRGRFTQEEEKLIISLHEAVGNRWAQIASHLPGRTDNEIKNYWNSWIKKKIRKPGRIQNNLASNVKGGYQLKLDEQRPLHYELLNFNPNPSLFENICGTKPLTTTLEPTLPYPSLKNNFMFDTSSMISNHTDWTTAMSSVTSNVDLTWSFTDFNQKTPEVVSHPSLPSHPMESSIEMGSRNNNNYLPILEDGDHQLDLQYDQCLAKHNERHQGYNNSSVGDDELSLWDVTQLCPNFLFWENVVEGSSVVGEVAPFDPSLEGTATAMHLSSPCPSSLL